MEEEDRISRLPEHILHHRILSLLPQNDAVRTCVLSKSWRHLGLTRPKFEFSRRCFQGNEKFLSAVDNTLHRYDDQKLSIQEFILNIPGDDPQNYENSIWILDKWIPIVIMKMGVKTFKLTAKCSFSLPSVVFQAEILTELYLKYCKLDQINNCIVNLQVLKRLELWQVDIEEKTFEKIMSSCPLIEHLHFYLCSGLSVTKVNKARNLRHLNFRSRQEMQQASRPKEGATSFGHFEIDDAPNIETIRISGSPNRYHLHIHRFDFPHLKSLILWFVRLPTTGLLNNLSLNCPCLQVLEFHYCPGLIRESMLSNHSIKRLFIGTHEHPFTAAIDVPNVRNFEFEGTYLPSSISFGTTSREWESVIHVGSYLDPKVDSDCPAHLDPIADDWPLKLHDIFKALSQSRISPNIYYLPLTTNQDMTCDGGSCDPVAVKRMCLRALYSSSQLPALLNCLFRTFVQGT